MVQHKENQKKTEKKRLRKRERSVFLKDTDKGTQCDWHIILLSHSLSSRLHVPCHKHHKSKWQPSHVSAILGHNTVSWWKLFTFNKYISISGKSNEKHFRHTAHLHLLLLLKCYVVWMEIASETISFAAFAFQLTVAIFFSCPSGS